MASASLSCPFCGSSYVGNGGNVSLSQRKQDGKFTLDCPGCKKQLPGYIEGSLADGKIVPDPGFAFQEKKTACVALGTRIRLPDNTERRIECIEPGQQVLAYHDARRELVTSCVRRVVAHGSANVVRLVTTEGNIVATPKHRISADDRWLSVGELVAGNEITALDPKTGRLSSCRVQSIIWMAESLPVFNLYVDDACTFIANGFVTHSYVIAPNLRTRLNRVGVWFKGLVEAAPSPLPHRAG